MPSARDANWIDGLRGVASFMVVCGHLCTAFAPYLHSPAQGPNGTPYLFQYPFFRLCVGGRSAVALFFLITGYVNSIGPLSKAKNGDVDAAFTGIARSALARSLTLIIPTTIATFFSWFLANTNAYKMAEHVDATWIRQGYHRQEPTFKAAISSLLWYEQSTWTTGWNEYDGTQWTLPLFLQGAFLVYLTMLATAMVTPTARRLVFTALYIFGWLSYKEGIGPTKTLNIVFGMVVADLHVTLGPSATSTLPAPLPALLILFGMFLACYPQDNPEWAPWTRFMRDLMLPITPHGADIRRHWDSLGASTVLLGIFFSGTARRILTSPIVNFLGRVSFPVYLLHNQLIKSILVWMIYLPSALNPQYNEHGEKLDLVRGSTLHIVGSLCVFYYVLYRLAYAWTLWLDPVIARFVKKTTAWAYGEGRVSEKVLLL
ncbi:hypothetical protein K402DRAFT_333817 [Aulographum hederae CBS 113979]|uniref:Acyltransferase 3 domain-containing protein n=1 Tax=Aulographum hederae CBS 113979 TaxID=1176131 RepID=A0A6G1GYI4_9PEZI|nr:hypothetical protein K402DRAFT_333817 [Aulographum hederae CBS 113979]